MTASHARKLKPVQLIVLIAIFGFGCGIKGTANTTCSTGTAQISVLDGGVRRDCGCAEGGPSGIYANNTSLVCTVKVGTSVYVHYPNILNPHQIQLTSTGTNYSYHPGNDGTDPVDVIPLNTTGTINFIDNQTGFGGSFVVQP